MNYWHAMEFVSPPLSDKWPVQMFVAKNSRVSVKFGKWDGSDCIVFGIIFFWAVCLVTFTAEKNCGHCWVLVCHAVLCHWLPQPTKTASKSVSSTPQLEQTLQPGFCWSFGFCWAFIDPGHRQKYPRFHVLPRIPLWKGSQSCWSKGCLLLDSIPLSSNSHKLGFS